MYKLLFIILFLPIVSVSNILVEKYPGYSYVFNEFGIEESYIYNDTFIKFVLKNEKNIQNFYENSMIRGKNILPLLKENLIIDGLSDLFIYISMVESGFSPNIISSKKAVGLWQFMPATAKHYNLQVNSSIDERCDPVNSTNAAIRYLHKLHKQFGKWYLAIMAYNCGEGRLQTAINRAGSKELSVLLSEDKKYLPKETRDYIKKILLASMIGENKLIQYTPTDNLNSNNYLVKIKAGTRLRKIARLINMKPSELLKLNKQFKSAVIPKDREYYDLAVPEDKMILFYMRYEPFENRCKKDLEVSKHFVSYYVKLGDTLESIAKKYKTDAMQIKVVNNLEDIFLEIDKLLLIPVSEELFDDSLEY